MMLLYSSHQSLSTCSPKFSSPDNDEMFLSEAEIVRSVAIYRVWQHKI